jgi:5-methylcytosine-specific restriction endonuclease McrA
MRPQSDDFPIHVERAVEATLDAGVAAGRAALMPIAHPAKPVPRRRGLSLEVRCTVFRRDRFVCRYCGGKTVLTPVMELLAHLYPDIFPFESHAWRGGVTHPAFAARSPMVDHVSPGTSGADWTSMDNLVTACNPCNSIKAEFELEQLGWTRLPIAEVTWDGLTGRYRPLWSAAGRPQPERHMSWLKALGIADT